MNKARRAAVRGSQTRWCLGRDTVRSLEFVLRTVGAKKGEMRGRRMV